MARTYVHSATVSTAGERVRYGFRSGSFIGESEGNRKGVLVFEIELIDVQ